MNKVGRSKDYLRNGNIKLETEIKDEPLDLDDKCHSFEADSYSDAKQQDQVFVTSIDDPSVLKPLCRKSTTVQDHDWKSEHDPNMVFFDDMVKIEDDVNNINSDVNKELLSSQVQKFEDSKVIIKKRNIGRRKNLKKKSFPIDLIAESSSNSSRIKNIKSSEKGCNENVKGRNGSESMSDFKPKSFTCSFCNYKTSDGSNFKRHLLVHSEKKLLKCSECSYECNQKGSLKAHLLSHSNMKLEDMKLLNCHECAFECKLKGNLKAHLLTHSTTKLFQCPECDYECNHKNSLKIHLLNHSGTKLFKCVKCDYECNHKGSFKSHLLTHLDIKLFQCSECDFECNEKRRLNIHLLNHSNVKLYKCADCSYECNDKRDLRRHLLNHSKTNSFKCSECDYVCNRKNSLKVHASTHSGFKASKKCANIVLGKGD